MPNSLRPKTATVFAEGYNLQTLRKDAVAGLTVAIVALPLSMAIAIASHAPPSAGLVTAIVGGFLISLLGGSRFQIGGPAGAFIVLVSTINDTHGFDGLLLATLMAGALMVLGGVLRLGTLVRRVPHAVTVGFTAGIAVIIFASQIHDLLGLALPGREPAALIEKSQVLWAALASFSPAAFAVALLTIALILISRRIDERLPALLIAVVTASLAALLLGLDVETIGQRFGNIPATLPWPSLPQVSGERIWVLLPSALSLAVLGSIESLLSAVVADGMSGRRHRSNAELVAQGMANMVVPLFGGITATGTIARTATNIRAGAQSPVAGMLHAVFLLAFMMLAAPLLLHIPLAALAGILAVVCWAMAGWAELRQARGLAAISVILVTFLVTIFHDLISGIAAGIVLSLAFNFLAGRAKTSP